MPNHKFHRNFNLLILLPLACFTTWACLSAQPTEIIFFSLAFIYSTLFAGPDMDLANQIRLFSFQGIMTLPFKLFYAPFMKHRSKKLSHHFIWGSLSRLLALLIFFVFAFFLYSCLREILTSGLNLIDLRNILTEILLLSKLTVIQLYQLSTNNLWKFAYTLGGFFLADICHVFLDKLSK